MPAAAPWSTRLADDLISAELAAARAFYGDDGEGGGEPDDFSDFFRAKRAAAARRKAPRVDETLHFL